VIAAGRYVAVAVADDNEFYIGRNRVALCNISDRVRQLIGDLPAERRIVFVKGKTGIKYETLSSIIDEIHEADVSRVEVIPIKKNRSND
jgi:biopolymer transport protein ExbD